MEKLRMVISSLAVAWPTISNWLFNMLSALCKAFIGVLAIIGFLYCWSEIEVRILPETKPAATAGFKNIILDESRLVRCRTVDRSRPSCTMLSDCDDQVDRCVLTFEILNRPVTTGDYLPTEP